MNRELLSRYFGFTERVDRRMYLRTGVILVLVKYIVDATAVWLATGNMWTPFDYLVPLFTLRASKLAVFPLGLSVFLGLWAVPFIWIGMSMTLRRAVDAGKSPWLCLLFLIPFLNYVVMLWLALAPTDPQASRLDSARPFSAAGRVQSALAGVAIGAAIAVSIIALDTLVLKAYGLSVFLVSPFILGATIGFIHNRNYPRPRRETDAIVLLALLIVGLSLLGFALEGLVCILMAAPIGIAIAVMGAEVGRAVAMLTRTPTTAAYVVALLPVATLVDRVTPPSATFEAISIIDINAPPQIVWEHVIRFSEITARPALPFRLGIAFPIRARIEGAGAGAVRCCVFSTGSFVEPITTWDAPRRLSFNVASQPPALRELSPYSRVYAEHLNGFFKARRGEFRLVSLPGGRTRLEGSTWYSLDIYPQPYWRVIAEYLVERIHMRVLTHIKSESEQSVRLQENQIRPSGV